LRGRLLNLPRLQAQLAELGFERRLPWAIANTLEAIRLLYHDGVEATNLHPQTAPLQLFLEYLNERSTVLGSGAAPDILDVSIRTKKTVEAVQASSSSLSKRWGVVSTLQPTDFVDALEAVLGTP
jgi:hypothetical protein